MAKIVVFSDAIQGQDSRAHFLRQILNNAAETANEIYYVTQNKGNEEIRELHPKVQVLRAFKKWSLFEATQLLPVLFQLKADIFHFVQPLKKIGLNHAYPILAAFAKTSKAQVVLSLVEQEKKMSHGLRSMIAASSFVSVFDPRQALSIQGQFQNIAIESLPVWAFPDQNLTHETEVLAFEPFVFLPENLHLYEFPMKLVKILISALQKNIDLNLVCIGSQLDFDLKTRRQILQELEPVAGRIRWVGPLSLKQKLIFLKRAELTVLSGLRSSPQRLHENIGLILTAQAPTVMSPDQVFASQANIQNDLHAKVVEASEVESAISEVLNSQMIKNSLRNNLAELRSLHSQDHLGNRLNRIYAKLLS